MLNSFSNLQIDNTTITQFNEVIPFAKRRTKTLSSTIVGYRSLSKANIYFNCTVWLSIGETDGVRINAKCVSKLSCVSLTNNEIAVLSLEPV